MKKLLAMAAGTAIVLGAYGVSTAQTPPGTDRKSGEEGATSASPNPDKPGQPTPSVRVRPECLSSPTAAGHGSQEWRRGGPRPASAAVTARASEPRVGGFRLSGAGPAWRSILEASINPA